MPQSMTRLYAHLVFSTKNRQPSLEDIQRPRIHAYLATVIRDLDSPWVVVGGVSDHVHILFDLGKTVAPVKFVEQVKRESSKTWTWGNAPRRPRWPPVTREPAAAWQCNRPSLPGDIGRGRL